MTRFSLQLLFAICAANALSLVASQSPNVILILTDDQGYGDIRSHGNVKIDTPHLDRLADDGARFENFFVAPVCPPRGPAS